MAAYIVWLVLAPSISSYFYVSSIQAAELLLLPLVFFAWLLDVREDRAKVWDRTWNLLLATGLALAVWGTVDFLLFHERAHGPLIDTNAYGALINLILVPLIWKYFGTPKIASAWKGLRFQLLAIAVLALAQFMTLSRGALVALITILFVLLWLNREKDAFGPRLALLLLVLGTSYLFVKLGPINVGQLAGAGIEKLALNPSDYIERDSSLQTRLLLWKSTCAMIANSNALLGLGLGTFKTFYPQYRIEGEHSLGNYVHNDYLQALLEGGLVQFAFLVMLTGIVPIWLLVKNRHREEKISGLPLGILCVSIHAVVNFIHFVVPIVLVCGLYLAVSWQSVKEKHGSDTLNPLLSIRSGVIKLACVVLVVLQSSIVALDGLIFKVFGSAEPIVTDEQHRLVLLNAALALRPGNPTPHTTVILHLLDAAAKSESPETRYELLKSAEMETTILTQVAPSYPLVPLLIGKIWALRGSYTDLMTARDHLELAVKRTPHSTAMRTELIDVYRRLKRNQDAYRIVTEAKPWLPNETSLKSFGLFVKHAEELAVTQNKLEEAQYWRWVKAQIAEAMSKGSYSSRMRSLGR